MKYPVAYHYRFQITLEVYFGLATAAPSDHKHSKSIE